MIDSWSVEGTDQPSVIQNQPWPKETFYFYQEESGVQLKVTDAATWFKILCKPNLLKSILCEKKKKKKKK
jgi:hypothetical protein